MVALSGESTDNNNSSNNNNYSNNNNNNNSSSSSTSNGTGGGNGESGKDAPQSSTDNGNGSAAFPPSLPPAPPVQEIGLKFVLVGDSGSGKTNLLRRFVRGEFQEANESTVGIEFATRTLSLTEGVAIKAQIWDTCGQERFSSLTSAFFRGTVGAMLVYDIANRQSFLNLESWLNLVRAHAHKNIAMSLIANKLDLAEADNRQVSTAEGAWWADAHGLDFVETSAKDATYVETAFRRLIMSVAQFVWNDGNNSNLLLHNSSSSHTTNGNTSNNHSGGGGAGSAAGGGSHQQQRKSLLQQPATQVLPKGWVRVPSRVREGGVSYENMWTGERVSYVPTAPAVAFNTLSREALCSAVGPGDIKAMEDGGSARDGGVNMAMGPVAAASGVSVTCFNGRCSIM